MLSQRKAYQILKSEKNVRRLVKVHFNFDLTPIQVEIVRAIAYEETDRLSVCAMTRYGKTQCVAIGIALFILWNNNRKIMFIAPTRDKAAILRDYMADLVLRCPELINLADWEISGKERLKKEASKSRLTFKNGCEYRIFSAHGEGSSLMGFGVGTYGGIIIKDEACEIEDKANTKITRMVGDNPKNTMIVELFNPWTRDNKAFEHWNDPDWRKIHVSWKDALEEGRTTKDFIKRQRKEITPLEFTVLYDSEFPDEAEDSIFNLSKIKRAITIKKDFEKEIEEIEEKIKTPHKYTEFEFKKIKEELDNYVKVISCDLADKGLDETVMYWGIRKHGFNQVLDSYSEPKSESSDIIGRICEKIKTFIGKKTKGIVNLDVIGLGTGPVSLVKEFVRDNNYDNVKVVGCHFGKTADNTDRFANKKAENYFRLKEIFDDDMISLPDIQKLSTQLLVMRWGFNSSSKIKIIDPDKSPDFADALVYFIWKEGKELVFAFA